MFDRFPNTSSINVEKNLHFRDKRAFSVCDRLQPEKLKQGLN